MGIFIGILEEGLIYAILALGVLITYRILDFPDLTVDSSFPLGAAVSAILTVNGMHPVLTLLMATLAGAAAGLVTGLIHVKCRVRDLLSGIITMTGLYSINLRIAGRANLPFFNMDTLFDNALVDSLPATLAPWSKVLVVLVIVLVVKVLLDLFMNTKAGFLLRAEGDNPAEVIMQLTGRLVREKGLTTLMVTHNLRYALEYGDRILMLHEGRAVLDKCGEEKRALKLEDVLGLFNQISVECGN